MDKYIVHIYGVIGKDVTTLTVQEQMRDFPENSDVTVKIHSPGGSIHEGYGIHELFVNSGHNITTQGEGLVGSIATVIFLAGKQRKLTENSRFFVHMPLLGSSAGGNAARFREIVQQLEEWEQVIIEFYNKRTGISQDVLKELMDNETEMSAQEALELGFATEVLTPVMALAKFDIKDMKSLSEIVASVRGIKNTTSKETEAKEELQNLTLATSAGINLFIQTQNTYPSEGDVVTIDGKAPENGEYDIPSAGMILVIEEGKVVNIFNKVDEIDAQEVLDKILASQTEFQANVEGKIDPVLEAHKTQSGELAELKNEFALLQEQFNTLLNELGNLEATNEKQAEEIEANKLTLEKAREVQSTYVPKANEEDKLTLEVPDLDPVQAHMQEISKRTKGGRK